MAEYFDHFLTVDHFLDKAFAFADRALLFDKVFCRVSADLFGDEHHYGNSRHHNERHIQAETQHYIKDGHDGHERGQKLGHRLRYKLSERVDIVGVIAHDIAVIMGVEVFDRQLLHTVKHLFAQLIEESLRDIRSELCICKRRNERENIH